MKKTILLAFLMVLLVPLAVSAIDISAFPNSSYIKHYYSFDNTILDGVTAGKIDLTEHETSNNLSGRLSQARWFAGSDQFLNGSSKKINITNSWTISTWMMPFTNNSDNVILDIHQGGTVLNRIMFFISSKGKLGFQIHDSADVNKRQYLITSESIRVENWHMLTVVYDSKNTTVYINGSKVKVGSDSALDNDAITMTDVGDRDLYVGSYFIPLNYFKGKLDELVIYSGNLSASEVSSLYGLTGGNFSITATNYYNLTSIKAFNVSISNNKNYSTTTGIIVTNLTISPSSSKNITITAKNYTTRYYNNQATSSPLAAVLRPYTMFKVRALANNATVSGFSINWTGTSTGHLYTNSFYLMVPLWNGTYTATVYNMTSYSRQSKVLHPNPSNYTHNFSVYRLNMFNIVFYNEENNTRLPENKSTELNIVGNSGVNVTSKSLSNHTYEVALLTPDTYLLNYNVTGYYMNNYYSILTNGTYQNLTLYNFPTSTTAADLRVRVKTSSYIDYPNIIVKLQRFYPSTGTWVTVQMDKSGAYGYVYFKIVETTVNYRLIFLDSNGNVLLTSATTKYQCSSSICDVTAIISSGQVFTDTPMISIKSNLANNSENGTITWNFPDGTTHAVQMYIKKPLIGVYQTLCSYSQSGSAGTFACNTTNTVSEVLVQVRIDGEDYSQFFVKISTPKLESNLGKRDSVFFAIVIMLTLVGFGLFSPIAAIVMTVLFLVIVSTLGLLSALTTGMVILAAIVAIIIGLKIRGNP